MVSLSNHPAPIRRFLSRFILRQAQDERGKCREQNPLMVSLSNHPYPIRRFLFQFVLRQVQDEQGEAAPALAYPV